MGLPKTNHTTNKMNRISVYSKRCIDCTVYSHCGDLTEGQVDRDACDDCRGNSNSSYKDLSL